MIPGLAGMAEMPYRRFLAANIAGGATWGAAMAIAGYLADINMAVMRGLRGEGGSR